MLYLIHNQERDKERVKMINRIDRRRNYYLMVDVETCNTIQGEKGLGTPFVYDLGIAVIDKNGNVYEQYSLLIKEVYIDMEDLMTSAYYGNKLPQYEEERIAGLRDLVTFYQAKELVKSLCEKYGCKSVIAHNAGFDLNSLNNTQRYLTNSKYRYFFPYGIEIWDTLKMAQDTICKQKTYIRWCEENNYLTEKGRKPKATAEVLYKYIIGDNDFKESHTGLEDVLIEKEIFAKCMRQHKKMRKKLYENC